MMKARIMLFLKGVCMGVADVIPGVSGGTLALILGIYRELVDTIRGLSPRPLRPLWAWLSGGRKAEDFEAFKASLGELNLPFLVTLGAGIACALGVGSAVIPPLLENFPEIMRALFFGLILGSVYVPFTMIEFDGKKSYGVAAAAVVIGTVLGFVATNPGRTFEASLAWKTIDAGESETLKEITRRGPAALTSEQVFWADENAALRDAVQESSPQTWASLLEARNSAGKVADGDKAALKARAAPYDAVEVPAGTPVEVPTLAFWFVFMAGMIAICAMILPGISGSYLLLILGAYFFILNSLKGFLGGLASGQINGSAAVYVVIFSAGAGIGILSFSRLLSFLLDRFPVATLGVLVGLMVGCLRGIWPFRAEIEGVTRNVMPQAFDANVGLALAAAVVGMVIVALFTWWGRREEAAAIAH
jgi:putative membrane protein